ncbi:MAG TPA: hypothetical protein VLB72_08145, partial [Burkholderiales bacterium]|nr:hypothetical protein [Burkholderiales bacterium]
MTGEAGHRLTNPPYQSRRISHAFSVTQYQSRRISPGLFLAGILQILVRRPVLAGADLLHHV